MSARPSIVCPRCGRESFNPHDIRERYCGFCHVFLGDGAAGEPTTTPDGIVLRADQPSESIVFHAHAGVCRYCVGGVVKMRRHPETLELVPKDCRCLQCGQAYHVDVVDLAAWEADQ